MKSPCQAWWLEVPGNFLLRPNFQGTYFYFLGIQSPAICIEKGDKMMNWFHNACVARESHKSVRNVILPFLQVRHFVVTATLQRAWHCSLLLMVHVMTQRTGLRKFFLWSMFCLSRVEAWTPNWHCNYGPCRSKKNRRLWVFRAI